MVWNNSTTLSAFITSVVTSSTNFDVLICVEGSPYTFIDDPVSYTIVLPISNSNVNPFVDSNLLGGTCSFASLNSSKGSCVATLSICSLVAWRPFYVSCC
jgi:hypothetical protein